MHCIVRRKTSIFFPRISTYSWNGSYISSRTYSRMNIRMKDESRTCRIPANAGREASTVVYVELPHCELFHFTLSPFVEWKLSTSHPSNPVSMHLLLTSYITITPHACPLSPGYLHRDLALFHSSKSTCTDYILAEYVHRLIALLIRATYDSAFLYE